MAQRSEALRMPLLARLQAVGPTVIAGLVMARAPHRVIAGLRLARHAAPYERRLAQADRRVLVAGDSTGVGAGAASAQETIAAMLARDFRNACVSNVARHGARCRDLPQQIAASPHARYDLVLLFAGGNDVLNGTPADQLARDVEAALAAARQRADAVVFVSTPDIGHAPLFPWPVSTLLSRRTYAAREIFVRASRAAGVAYLDFLAREHDRHIAAEPLRYFAADGLHPSSHAYAYCYRALLAQGPMTAALKEGRGMQPRCRGGEKQEARSRGKR